MKLTYLLVAAAALSLSSCSLINSVLKTDTKDSAETVSATTTSVKAETPSKAQSEDKKSQNKKTEKKDVKKMNPDGDKLDERIDGEWVIISAGGKTVPASDDMPYINFMRSEERFYASNGCNVLNGSYIISPAGVVTFDHVLSTMKMCPETDYEIPISSVLSGSEPVKVKITDMGHETYLSLLDSKGTEIMARKHNMDFLNGNWRIMTVNGKTVKSEEATIFMDINELKVHGNTGCNFFNGDLFINPEKSNAIDFSNLISTRMACPNMDEESAIMLALEETASAIQGSDRKVMLLSATGKELMTLMSIPVQAEE